MHLNRRRLSIAIFAIAVFCLNIGITAHESQDAPLITVLYGGIAPFAAAYAPAPGQPDMPSPLMTTGLLAALLLTFSAVFSFIAGLSRVSRARLTSKRRIGQPVVFGSSPEAEAITRSFPNEDGENTIRILEEENPTERGSLGIGNQLSLSGDRIAFNAVERASKIILAGSNDYITAKIAAEALSIRSKIPSNEIAIFQLVRSPELTNSARLSHLSELEPVVYFHPADLTARAVLDRILPTIDTNETLAVYFEECESTQESLQIKKWLSHYIHFTNLLRDNQLNQVGNAADADVIILAGDAALVAARVPTFVDECRVIAVTQRELVELACPNSRDKTNLSLIDPAVAGFNQAQISRSTFSEWGWAFHRAHGLLYGDPQRVPSVRDTQSSEAAARFMIVNLENHGFYLVSDDYGWIDGTPTTNEVESMAKSEHDDWMTNRLWTDDAGQRRPVSHDYQDGEWAPGRNCVPFSELDHEAREYNRKIILTVYPALAAMFGYGLARRS